MANLGKARRSPHSGVRGQEHVDRRAEGDGGDVSRLCRRVNENEELSQAAALVHSSTAALGGSDRKQKKEISFDLRKRWRDRTGTPELSRALGTQGHSTVRHKHSIHTHTLLLLVLLLQKKNAFTYNVPIIPAKVG